MTAKEGWALPLGTKNLKAKFHYFRQGRAMISSLCYHHAQRPDFTPLDHPPLRAFCCKMCLRYLLVPTEATP